MNAFRVHRYNEYSLLVETAMEPLREANACMHGLSNFLRHHMGDLLRELVPAYRSLLAVCRISSDVAKMKGLVEIFMQDAKHVHFSAQAAVVTIPVCYDEQLGNDLALMRAQLKLSADEIINTHLVSVYHVYMLGFLPGFAYMGEVDEKIATPRKPNPVPTKAGAVGIAGRQTGIYPLDSPGGWHIVGYTPLKMFDVSKAQPAYLEAGDRVQFKRIGIDEFANWD